ncbi:MAG: hypothetical protein QNI86_11325 [Halieaceae bacterium]|nr:hypothetical protein [Halieaceae bacterium]
MKKTIALVAALASGSAFGACDGNGWPERPEIPNGEVATFEQMIEAQEAVAEFVKAGEAYMECVKPDNFVHNYYVDRLMRAAEDFNSEREAFLRREAIAAN